MAGGFDSTHEGGAPVLSVEKAICAAAVHGNSKRAVVIANDPALNSLALRTLDLTME